MDKITEKTERLQKLRDLTRTTYVELANEVGKTVETVKAIVNGNKPNQHFSQETAEKVERSLERRAANLRDALNRLSGGAVN